MALTSMDPYPPLVHHIRLVLHRLRNLPLLVFKENHHQVVQILDANGIKHRLPLHHPHNNIPIMVAAMLRVFGKSGNVVIGYCR